MDDEDDDRSARAPEPDDVIRICRALNDSGARYQDPLDRAFLEGVLRERASRPER